VRDIISMTGTLPPQPPSAFINFQALGSPSNNLGWWNATNQSWINAGTSPTLKPLGFFVDTNNCLCINMGPGHTLTPTTDNGVLTIYLPDQPPGWQGWLYVADDGSTYFDFALTNLAQAPPTDPGDNCRVVPNPEQYDRDGDGEGDACDPNDGEVQDLRVLADAETVDWNPEVGALSYNLYRVLLSNLSATNYGACLDPGTNRDADLNGRPDATDVDVPPAGDGYGYLSTAETPGGEGSLGRDSSGTERPNNFACP
jgi:hypothetical protein